MRNQLYFFAMLIAACVPACRTTQASRPSATLPLDAASASTSVESTPIDGMTAQPVTVESMTVESMVERARTRDYWPDQTTDWRLAPAAERQALLATPACREFTALIMPPASSNDPDKLRTDGIMVVKGGRVYWEAYDAVYSQDLDKLHCMWSATKSFTAGVVGAVAEQSARLARGDAAPAGRLTQAGDAIGLQTPLRALLPATTLNQDPAFAELTVEHLLGMAPNLQWSERYEDKAQESSIVKMLWINGYGDMARYAANQPFGPEGPGNRYLYSSGNALILMRALQPVYGAAYDRMPWDVLFDRIGMRHVAFEQDGQGVFVGSSYLHTTLRDMAKFGYLYLNGGWYKDQQVLPLEFVRKARSLSLGMRASGTSDQDILDAEAFYGLGFWLNLSPGEVAASGARSFAASFPRTKFFPNAPSDVFLASGHYGQNILIYPREDLLVVRYAHDKEYWSKLDRILTLAKACFAPDTQPSQSASQ